MNTGLPKNRATCRVLWLQPAGAVGGSTISLSELLKPLVPERVSGVVVAPEGSAANRFREQGLEVVAVRGLSQWDNTRFSGYRGVRWLILLRELLLLPGSIGVLLALRKRVTEFDLIHVNDITLLPLGVMAQRLLKLPLMVHVRCLQTPDSTTYRSRWINRMLERNAAAVVAIDETVRRTLPASLKVHIIHNVLNVETGAATAGAGDRGTRFRVAMVGGLLVNKGVYEFVEAARMCRDRGLDVSFVIAGENARELKGIYGRLVSWLGFGRDVRADLERFVKENQLEGVVELKGFTKDVGALYRGINVLCFPSHLNATGRPVFEAAFYGVPSIVAVDDPPADSVVAGVTGVCIPSGDPAALADAIERMYRDPEGCRRMGQAALELAERYYRPAVNAEQLYALYCKVSGREI